MAADVQREFFFRDQTFYGQSHDWKLEMEAKTSI